MKGSREQDSSLVFDGSERGAGLVGMLVAVAILGIAVTGLARVFSNTMTMNRAVETLGKLEDIRKLTRQNLDCRASLDAAAPCTGSFEVINGRTFAGTTLFSTPYSTMATTFRVRALCRPSAQNQIFIEVMKTDLGGDPVAVPLAGIEADWNDLFAGIPIECPPP